MIRASSLLLALLALPPALLASCSSASAPRPAATTPQRYNGEGLRRLERGDIDGADEMFRDALREAELVDDLPGQATAWNNLGAVASARGLPRDAWGYHASALRLYQLRGVRDVGEVRARTNLGAAMLQLGAEREAEEQFKQAAALAAELDADAGGLARVGLAAAALRRGDGAAAVQQAEREVSMAERRGEASTQAAALAIAGAGHELLGEVSVARERYEQALALDRKRELPRAVAEDLMALGRLSERQGDRAVAASYLGRAARIFRQLGALAQAEDALQRAVTLVGGQGDEARLLAAELAAVQATRAASLRPASSTSAP